MVGLSFFFLNCCASHRTVSSDMNEGFEVGARQFVTSREGSEVQCWSATVKDTNQNVYLIFENKELTKIVNRLPTYSNGVRIQEDVFSRIERTIRQESLKMSEANQTAKVRKTKRSPSNILPAFILVSPFLAIDAIIENQVDKIQLGTDLSNLPQFNQWKKFGNLYANPKLCVAVNVVNGRVTDVFERDFYWAMKK
jgi:hypothetical protein